LEKIVFTGNRLGLHPHIAGIAGHLNLGRSVRPGNSSPYGNLFAFPGEMDVEVGVKTALTEQIIDFYGLGAGWCLS
jgi:hypothetical protein